MQQYSKNLFYLFAFVGLTIFLYFNRQLFFSLKNLSYQNIIFLSFFSLLAIYLNASQLRYITEAFDVRLKCKEWFGLAVANTMHNYYTPARGGTVLKAIYLKKSHNLAYSNFISLTTGTYFLGFFLASAAAVFFNLLSLFVYHEFYKAIFSISLTLFTTTAVIGFFSLKLEFSAVFKKIPRLHKFVLNVEKGLSFFKNNKKLLIKILLFKFLFIVIMAIKLYWAFKAIGIETNLVNILIVQSLVVFSMVLSLTPGNIGIREGIIGLLSTMLDIPLKEAVLGALVDRAVMMCIVIFLGLIFTKVLTEELEKQNSLTESQEPAQMEDRLL